MEAFGSILRRLRLAAGLGLRTFANLIDQRASTVSAIESHQRGPWRQADLRRQAAQALALTAEDRDWKALVETPHAASELAEVPQRPSPGVIRWWTLTQGAEPLDGSTLAALAGFIAADEAEIEDLSWVRPSSAPLGMEPGSAWLTDLAVEWRARRLLGSRDAPAAAAPIDVEGALEAAGVRLEVMPGLSPRFSVQCCLTENDGQVALLVDRAVADAHPIAAYRFLLASTYAPIRLREAPPGSSHAESTLGEDSAEYGASRYDCQRFALAMMLPAGPLQRAAQAAYCDLVDQQGWLPLAAARRSLCNRLANQFAVPANLVDARLAGWPSHIYDRLEIALAAGERTLPPTDWLDFDDTPRQLTLFS